MRTENPRLEEVLMTCDIDSLSQKEALWCTSSLPIGRLPATWHLLQGTDHTRAFIFTRHGLRLIARFVMREAAAAARWDQSRYVPQ